MDHRMPNDGTARTPRIRNGVVVKVQSSPTGVDETDALGVTREGCLVGTPGTYLQLEQAFSQANGSKERVMGAVVVNPEESNGENAKLNVQVLQQYQHNASAGQELLLVSGENTLEKAILERDESQKEKNQEHGNSDYQMDLHEEEEITLAETKYINDYSIGTSATVHPKESKVAKKQRGGFLRGLRKSLPTGSNPESNTDKSDPEPQKTTTSSKGFRPKRVWNRRMSSKKDPQDSNTTIMPEPNADAVNIAAYLPPPSFPVVVHESSEGEDAESPNDDLSEDSSLETDDSSDSDLKATNIMDWADSFGFPSIQDLPAHSMNAYEIFGSKKNDFQEFDKPSSLADELVVPSSKQSDHGFNAFVSTKKPSDANKIVDSDAESCSVASLEDILEIVSPDGDEIEKVMIPTSSKFSKAIRSTKKKPCTCRACELRNTFLIYDEDNCSLNSITEANGTEMANHSWDRCFDAVDDLFMTEVCISEKGCCTETRAYFPETQRGCASLIDN